MGLAIDSIKGTFHFLSQHPKSFLFAAVMMVFAALGSRMEVFSFFTFYITANPFAFLALFVPGLVILAISHLILAGGFPLLVTQALKKKKVYISRTIKESLNRISDIFIAFLLLGLIGLLIFLPIILMLFLYPLQNVTLTPYLFVPAILSVPALIIGVYLSLRLALTLQVLMIERKGAIASIKTSWRLMKGKVISLLAANILLGLVVALPLALIGFMVQFFAAKMLTFAFFVASSGIISSIWNMISSVIISTFSGVLFTVYYYGLKQ